MTAMLAASLSSRIDIAPGKQTCREEQHRRHHRDQLQREACDCQRQETGGERQSGEAYEVRALVPLAAFSRPRSRADESGRGQQRRVSEGALFGENLKMIAVHFAEVVSDLEIERGVVGLDAQTI